MRHPLRSRIGAVTRRQMTTLVSIPLTFVLCLFAWSCSTSGADPFAENPKPTPAVRPGEAPKAVLTKIDIGQAALFRTTGSVYDAFAWRVRPAEAEAAFLKLRTEDGEPVALCFYGEPYTVSLGCATVEMIDGLPKLALDVDSIHLGDNGPPPPPPPPPSPVVFGLIIEEKDDRTKLPPQQVFIFESRKIRDLFEKFEIYDDDIEGEAATKYKTCIDRARNLIGQPALFMFGKSGNVAWEGPVPKDVPATVKLIKEYQ